MSTKVKLAEANEEQLRQFAEAHIGITFPHNTKPETMRAKIAAAWNKDEIPVGEPPQESSQSGSPPPARADQKKQPDKVRVIIQITEDAGGDEPVQLGVNGSIMLVPRGQEVDIPFPYFEVLQNAVQHRYEAYPDGGINPVPRKVIAYPYQRIA